MVPQETGLSLSDGRLDGGDGIGSEGVVVDRVENDVSIHLVQLRAGYRAEDAGQLAAMKRNVGGGDVLAVEYIGSTRAGRKRGRHGTERYSRIETTRVNVSTTSARRFALVGFAEMFRENQ